jgi:NAD(P)-dependent dehydrogenase (short-subunit alcohol dehydrogenase family)
MAVDAPNETARLNGQVAIVTGGGRGIGRVIAIALASEGSKVCVAARSRDQLTETVETIRENGGSAIAIQTDVTDQSAVERLVTETERQLGPITLLVNNAGIADTIPLLWEGAADDWWRVIEINLRGPFLCARAVLPSMIRRRHGRIINLASGAGGRPFRYYSAYPVSKAALFRLTDSLAEMTEPYGISVFAISPGRVHTDMTDSVPIFKGAPESRWTPIERVGELCVRLAMGQADALSGRFIRVLDDLDDLIQRADEITQKDLYVLRLRNG